MVSGSPARPSTRRVLLVEDEDSLRRLVQLVLQQQGFEVLAAADGLEGLALGLAYAATIELLVTDLDLPELDGRALALKLRETRSDLKILMISGNASPELKAALGEPSAFLAKPFTPAGLLEKIRALLGASGE